MESTIHIGFLTPEYSTSQSPEGGLANYVRNVAAGLSDRGLQVSILVLSSRNAEWRDGRMSVYEVQRAALPRIAHRTRVLRRVVPATEQLLSCARMASAVWAVHGRAPFDVLQAANYKAPAYRLLKRRPAPLVCRISTYTPMWREAYGRSPSFSERVSDRLEVRQVRGADAAYAPSRLMADVYARHGCRVDVIRTPFLQPEIHAWAAAPSILNLGRPYLLFFGTLSAIKGVDVLAQTIPMVCEKYPAVDFVLIGRDDRLATGQKAIDYVTAASGSYRQRVHYRPASPKAELYPVIAGAAGVVLPSRIDNYPNACLESQALGIPVVGTYGSSLDEMIVEGETGFLAENVSPSSLLAAIDRLLALSEAQRQAMRNRILAAVDARIEEDPLGQLVAFYESVIARSS